MARHITIFTRTTCAYCVMVKKYLGAKGQEYEEVNIDEHPEREAEARELSGTVSVPVTVITRQDDSTEVVVGYNLAKLAAAVA